MVMRERKENLGAYLPERKLDYNGVGQTRRPAVRRVHGLSIRARARTCTRYELELVQAMRLLEALKPEPSHCGYVLGVRGSTDRRCVCGVSEKRVEDSYPSSWCKREAHALPTPQPPRAGWADRFHQPFWPTRCTVFGCHTPSPTSVPTPVPTPALTPVLCTPLQNGSPAGCVCASGDFVLRVRAHSSGAASLSHAVARMLGRYTRAAHPSATWALHGKGGTRAVCQFVRASKRLGWRGGWVVTPPNAAAQSSAASWRLAVLSPPSVHPDQAHLHPSPWLAFEPLPTPLNDLEAVCAPTLQAAVVTTATAITTTTTTTMTQPQIDQRTRAAAAAATTTTSAASRFPHLRGTSYASVNVKAHGDPSAAEVWRADLTRAAAEQAELADDDISLGHKQS